ncbi:MAG TPA: FkbM family methyltransferase [Bryobacteraceae bacterium]|nr:FkbM family methyltransferase [Bryobacteraceae bacterium]
MRRQKEINDRIIRESKLLRTDGALEQWQTPRGLFWTPTKSRYGLHFHLAEQERKIYFNGEHTIKKGDIVLDCGANIGPFTRVALDAGASKVIAVEPAPENLECLRRSFKDEIASGRVVLYPKGVWHKDDMLTMIIDETNSAADSFVMKPKGSTATTFKLPLTTIDKLVAELKLPRVDFVKMDIEGSETNALTGARGTLTKHHPRLSVCVYHRADHPESVPKAIRAAAPYESECGPCNVDNGRIHPQIFYFH